MELLMTNAITTNTLADAYALAKAELDAAQKAVDALRKEILATGVEKVTGDCAIVEVALSERATFDAKVAKTFLTPQQVAACTNVTLVTTLRIKAKV
jgi:hypothetical protein